MRRVVVRKPKIPPYLKALIYGKPDAGKTTLAAGADLVQKMERALIIDSDGGALTLTRHVPNVDVVTIYDLEQFSVIHDFLRQHLVLKKELNKSKKGGKKGSTKIIKELFELERTIKPKSLIGEKPIIYNTVIIDSLTEVQKQIMAHLLGINVEEVNLDEKIPETSQYSWTKNADRVRLLVRTFRNLPLNVLFTAHEKTIGEEGETRETVPSLPGALSNEIMGLIDFVCYLYKKNQAALEEDSDEEKESVKKFSNILLTQSRGNYRARDRYNLFPQGFVKNPTMKKISNAIENRRKNQ